MVKTGTREDPLDPIRQGHWHEIAEYLGQPVNRVRETFRLYLKLLDKLGYALVRKSEDPPAKATPASPAELVAWDSSELYTVIEGAIIEVTEKRFRGERVSDQAEVRAILRDVEAYLSRK